MLSHARGLLSPASIFGAGSKRKETESEKAAGDVAPKWRQKWKKTNKRERNDDHKSTAGLHLSQQLEYGDECSLRGESVKIQNALNPSGIERAGSSSGYVSSVAAPPLSQQRVASRDRTAGQKDNNTIAMSSYVMQNGDRNNNLTGNTTSKHDQRRLDFARHSQERRHDQHHHSASKYHSAGRQPMVPMMIDDDDDDDDVQAAAIDLGLDDDDDLVEDFGADHRHRYQREQPQRQEYGEHRSLRLIDGLRRQHEMRYTSSADGQHLQQRPQHRLSATCQPDDKVSPANSIMFRAGGAAAPQRAATHNQHFSLPSNISANPVSLPQADGRECADSDSADEHGRFCYENHQDLPAYDDHTFQKLQHSLYPKRAAESVARLSEHSQQYTSAIYYQPRSLVSEHHKSSTRHHFHHPDHHHHTRLEDRLVHRAHNDQFSQTAHRQHSSLASVGANTHARGYNLRSGTFLQLQAHHAKPPIATSHLQAHKQQHRTSSKSASRADQRRREPNLNPNFQHEPHSDLNYQHHHARLNHNSTDDINISSSTSSKSNSNGSTGTSSENFDNLKRLTSSNQMTLSRLHAAHADAINGGSSSSSSRHAHYSHQSQNHHLVPLSSDKTQQAVRRSRSNQLLGASPTRQQARGGPTGAGATLKTSSSVNSMMAVNGLAAPLVAASQMNANLAAIAQSGGGGGGGRRAALDNATRLELGCCGKMAKFLLFIANVLFWSAGIALSAWGILALVDDHKYNLSQLLVFDSNTRMSLFQLLSWSFITLGCATILVGVCGCSAMLKNSRWILGLYIFLILAIFALDLATGLLAMIFQERLVANVRLRLVNKLRNEYGLQASFTAAIDYIQTRYECCGLEGHFDYDQSLWRLQRLGGFEATVARTCCHLRNTFDDQAHVNPRPVNESMCQSTDVRFHQSYRYRRGCLDDLERLIRHKIWTFTIGCGIVGGIILLSLALATCFCRSIPSGDDGEHADSSGAAAGKSARKSGSDGAAARKDSSRLYQQTLGYQNNLSKTSKQGQHHSSSHYR